MSDDPATVRSVAVSREDVVDAFVYGRENPGTASLRVTPPFHGRMRARLHVSHGPADDGAIHLRPADLLADAVVAAYPSIERVEVDLGVDRETAPERVREAHADAIERWRERATSAIVEEVALVDGHAVAVKSLGPP